MTRKTKETSELQRLREENKRLKAEQIAIQNDRRLVTCVFCGHVFPLGTLAMSFEALREVAEAHLAGCPGHPVLEFRVRAEAAEKYLNLLRSCFFVKFLSDPMLSHLEDAARWSNKEDRVLDFLPLIQAEHDYRQIMRVLIEEKSGQRAPKERRKK